MGGNKCRLVYKKKKNMNMQGVKDADEIEITLGNK